MRFFEELEGLIANKIGTIKSLLSITKLEARLAGLSLLPLIICLVLLLVNLSGLWLVTNLLFGYLVWLYFNKIIYALIIVLIINFLLFILLKRLLFLNLKRMSFSKTREYFTQVVNITEKPKYEGQESTANRDFKLGKTVTKSTDSSE